MKIDKVRNLLKNVLSLSDYSKVIKLNIGWSKDEKYYIESEIGEKFLLRVSDIEYYNDKKEEYMIMKEIYDLNIKMSAPIDFGKCDNNKYVYLLLSWIEGTAANEIITTFSEEEQYNLGIKAGLILKKFHSISAPDEQEDWEQRMLKKFDYHLERYKTCGIKVPNDNIAIKYINENLHLLKNRPQTFHHGDFHIGNFIITSDNTLGIIDFNRWDFGDPYEDFYKMMLFSRELSIPFAIGQIHGYFNNRVPNDFFEILALYIADVILFSVVWAIPFGENEIKEMLKRAEMIFSDYEYFNSAVPKWFPY
ncbi:phosphotransferase [bacterium]|nr:phosphotransferase [bacterium]